MLKLLSSISMISILIYFIIMIYLHKTYQNYHPIHQAVSDYGVGPSKKWFSLCTTIICIGNIALAISLYLLPYDFSFKRFAILMILLKVLTVIGVRIYPTDLEGERVTHTGRKHLIYAVIQFTAVAIFVFNMTTYMTPITTPTLQLMLKIFENITKFGLIAFVMSMFIRSLKGYYGLFERIFLYSGAIYFFLISLVIFMKA